MAVPLVLITKKNLKTINCLKYAHLYWLLAIVNKLNKNHVLVAFASVWLVILRLFNSLHAYIMHFQNIISPHF